jgi:alcohol dehydrogenase class IV
MKMFSVPTQVVAGLGSASEAGDWLHALGARRIVAVVDEGVHRLGLADAAIKSVGASGDLEICHLTLAPVDPTIESAEEAAVDARAAGADGVLIVGGGSALSLGKAVAVRLRNSATISAYASGPLEAEPAPSVAVPTTAGSGGEVSNALVLYDNTSEKNVGIRGRGMEPNVALLDATLLVGLPDIPMLDAAADALSHAFEALWARGASRFTDGLAHAAIQHIYRALPRAIRGRVPEDLQELLEASSMANFACGNAGLGLVHALSGAAAVKVAHGRQNSVLLPHVAAFNREVVSAQTRAEIDQLADLYESAGLSATWAANAPLPDDVDEVMIRAALASPFHRNNRRESDADQLRTLLAGTRTR